MNQSWSIILFCYNEKGNVGNVISQTKKALSQMTNLWEIVIVDDGSTDGCIKEIEDLLDVNTKLIKHITNKGIGNTLLTGYKNVQYENVCGIPADGEFDINELLPYHELKENTFISFYREVKTSYSSYRDVLSILNRRINSIFLGIKLKDVNWVKAYKNNELKKLDLKLTSSLVESEICSKFIKKGFSAIEVLSIYHKRKAGVSKGGSFKVVTQAGLEIIKLIFIIFNFRIKNENPVN